MRSVLNRLRRRVRTVKYDRSFIRWVAVTPNGWLTVWGLLLCGVVAGWACSQKPHHDDRRMQEEIRQLRAEAGRRGDIRSVPEPPCP